MSTLEKLTIQGVRNFGTDAVDQQRIVFYNPVTLILGQNGCGKTTVIECIKYALTGQLPPNCKDGQGFIHDPKVRNMVESVGQVKLQMRSVTKDRMTVSRSAKVTQKGKGKPTFKSMDATLSVQKDGKETSISKRCVDVNTEMCRAMGVSKAIIDNVLFCHQEDSSWPLGTDKELKEKFDAIFGTTEYNKGVETIRKKRKKYETMVKDKAADLKNLQFVKTETERKQAELQNVQLKLEHNEEKYKQHDSDLVPVLARITEISAIEQNIGNMLAEKAKLESSCENNKKNQHSLREHIKDVFMGTESALDEKLQSFLREKSTTQKRLNESEKDLQNVMKQKYDMERERTRIDRDKAVFVHKRGLEQDKYAERAHKIRKLCELLNIPVDFDLENSNDRHDGLMRSIAIALADAEDKVIELSGDYDLVDAEQQEKVNDLLVNRTSVESDLTSKRDQLKQLSQEKIKNEQTIKSSEKNEESLRKVNIEIKKLEEIMVTYQGKFDVNAMRAELNENKNAQAESRAKLIDIDEQILYLNSVSSISAEIDEKEAQLKMRDSEVRRLKNKHRDNFKYLFGNQNIEGAFKQTLDTVHQALKIECTRLQDEIKKNQQDLTEIQVNHKNRKGELKTLETTVVQLVERIEEQCQEATYDDILQLTKDEVAKLIADHSESESLEILNKRYIQKLGSDPCCPLCHKDMTGGEVHELTDELQSEMNELPQKIDAIKLTLRQANIKLENLLGLRSDVERLEKIQTTDIPELKRTVTDLDKKLATAKSEKIRLEKAFEVPKQKIDKINASIIGDMSLLDKAIEDQQRFQREITERRESMPQARSDLSMDAAQELRKTINEDLTTQQEVIDEQQKNIAEKAENVQLLKEQYNNRKSDQLRYQESGQAVTQIRITLDEIKQKIATIENDIRELGQKLQPLKAQLHAAIDDRQRTKKENSERKAKEEKRVHEFHGLDNDIKRISKEIENLAKENIGEKIKELSETFKALDSDIKEKDKEYGNIDRALEHLRKEITGQELIERDLKDNKEFKKLQREAEQLIEELNGLKKKMGDMDTGRLQEERNALAKKRDTLSNSRSKLSGQIQEQVTQADALTKVLAEPKYKKSIQNYLHGFYEHIVLKKVVADLDNYCVALEKALLQYHSDKMSKINSLIKELWRTIYRGNDIDYIEIQTDHELASSTTKRRSYNYRVIQSKNDVELDMRGRCSAGQRVLACLIIRIALAETFSSNCGVLALDEPTTNLDHSNIRSLCEALNEIVEGRRAESNFMLIVITHDENFIETMQNFQDYYLVSRSQEGKSLIDNVRLRQ